MKKYHKVRIELKPGDYAHDCINIKSDLFGILGADIIQDNDFFYRAFNEFYHTSLKSEAKNLPVFLIIDKHACIILLDIKDGFQRITDLGMISQEEALTHNNPDIREYGLKLAGKL